MIKVGIINITSFHLTLYSSAECEETQINDPEDIFTCCEMHELGDGNQCACVSPAINDPDNDGECCHPDPDDNTICFIGKFYKILCISLSYYKYQKYWFVLRV